MARRRRNEGISRSSSAWPASGSGEGWTWKFDPDLFPRLDPSPLKSLLGNALGPTAHICGDRSQVITWGEGLPKMTPPSVKTVIIPDCDHHVMVDQPLALVTAIRGVLAYWPPERLEPPPSIV